MSQLMFGGVFGGYSEAASRGLIRAASNQAVQAISVGLATTYTGLCLSNDAGSGRNLLSFVWGETKA